MDIIVNGARGRMGQEVCRLLQEDGHRLAAAVDRSGQDGCYARLADYTGPADVVIDFSNHEGVEELMAYCVQRGLPLVAATTGYTGRSPDDPGLSVLQHVHRRGSAGPVGGPGRSHFRRL